MSRGGLNAKASIEGVAQLNAKLLAAAAQSEAAARKAVRDELNEVGDDVRRGAPVDTGELRDSERREVDGLDGTVRVTARHGVFVEHGTSDTPAQPFVGPAAERSRRRFVARVSSYVKTALAVGGRR